MKRRFEEILEECLAAQFAGRRSVEESLSLYPSLAPDLEPLLRTAASVTYSFESLNPPAYLVERGRLRLLAASSERRRAREIANGVWGFGRTRMPWNIRQWGMLSTGVAAACALVLIGAVALMSGGGDGGNTAVEGSTPTSASATQFAANLEELQRQLEWVRARAGQGTVEIQDIEKLRQVTARLAGSGRPPDDAAREAVEKALSDQYALSLSLGENATEEQQDELQELTSETKKAANSLDVDLSSPTPTAAPTEPVASETPVDTATPTEAPTPTAPATETPAPTEAPTPTPTPPLQGVE